VKEAIAAAEKSKEAAQAKASKQSSLFSEENGFDSKLSEVKLENGPEIEQSEKLKWEKELLGLYISEAEGARFWLGVLNDLKLRGVEDILIASIDGLKGFPEAIAEVFHRTEVQLCVVHQIRNSLKYVVSKEQKAFMAELKLVYKATSKDMAEQHLLDLEDKWGKKYPAVIKSWNNNWEALSQYFKYPEPIRRVIYTTNIVEGFHRQIRKYTKNKGAFTSENALNKLIYCASQKVLEKWSQPMHNWGLIASQLQIHFEDRLNLGLK
jgi:transposase-like protein